MTDYLTIGQVAERLKVDRTTAWRWVTKDKLFPGARRKGISRLSHWIVPTEAVENFENNLQEIDTQD